MLRVIYISKTVLCKEVEIDLLYNYLYIDTDPLSIQQEQTSYAVYILSNIRELPVGNYIL
jgi:hypothetical protein